jgi:hypothetical protein
MSRIVLLLVIGLTLSCGSNDIGAVIEVGGRELLPRDIEHIMNRARGDTARVDFTVNSIVSRELILLDVTVRGFYDLPESQRVLYEKEREILQTEYYAYMLASVALDDDTIQALYDQLGTMVWYTILVTEDSLTADSLRTLALDGYEFDALVAENTIDPFYSQTRGENNYTDRMLTIDADREHLMDLETGEISNPGRIPPGWMIIRLDSLAFEPPPPFEERRDWLWDFVYAHVKEQCKIVLEDSLRSALHLTITPGIGELISSHAMDRIGNFSDYTEEEAWSPAYTWDGGERPVLWLAENVRSIPVFLPKDARDSEWVEEYCQTLGLYDIMRMNAIAVGLDTIPETASQIRRNQTDYILELYHEEVIVPGIDITEERLQLAYEENLESFLLPEARVFSSVTASDAAQVDLLYSILAEGGDPFDRIEDLTPTTILLAQGESLTTNPLYRDDIPEQFRDLLYDSDYGEIVVCSTAVDSRIAFRLEEEIPERYSPYEDALPQLKNIAFAQAEEEIVVRLVDSLKAVYHPVIDWEYFAGYYTPEDPDTTSSDQAESEQDSGGR